MASVLVLTACAQPEATMPHPDTVVDAIADDGDSLSTDDGRRYRLIGINAPEQGECLADAARNRLAQLVEGPVILTRNTEETDHHGRELVYVHHEDVLVNEVMVAEGLAIAVHSAANSLHTEVLFEAMEQARAAGVGLWDMASCGSGPVEPLRIVDVEHDPPGDDRDNLDGEYVVIANSGTEPVHLGGWTLRDESSVNRYAFPPGMVLEPGSTITVTSGDGPLGFGLGSPIWNNDGDTVYLVDDQGRFVDHVVVPG
jgi:endonuclease YncB( thermonuclease family)